VDFHTRHFRSPADLADPNMASSLNLPTNLESSIIIYSCWCGGTCKGTCNNSPVRRYQGPNRSRHSVTPDQSLNPESCALDYAKTNKTRCQFHQLHTMDIYSLLRVLSMHKIEQGLLKETSFIVSSPIIMHIRSGTYLAYAKYGCFTKMPSSKT
jgi:hypothetical protein